jgi:hypothetical protein
MPTTGAPLWTPSLANATISADFINNSYVYQGTQASLAAWMAAIGATYTPGNSVKYGLNSSGVLTATSSPTVPIQDYSWNGSAGTLLGMLNEGPAENLVKDSNGFNVTGAGTWTNNAPNWGAAPTFAQNVTGPDGVANSGWTWTSTNTNGLPGDAYYSTSGQNYQSVYAKAGNVGFIALGGGGLTNTFYFNLTTGAITPGTGNSNTQASIQQLANGWWRCSYNSNTNTFGIGAVSAVNGTTASGNSIQLFGAQSTYFAGGPRDNSSAPVASYIPTSGGTATTTADFFAIPASIIDPLLKFNDFTIYIQFQLIGWDGNSGVPSGVSLVDYSLFPATLVGLAGRSGSYRTQLFLNAVSGSTSPANGCLGGAGVNSGLAGTTPTLGSLVKAAVSGTVDGGPFQTAMGGSAGTVVNGCVTGSPSTYGWTPTLHLGCTPNVYSDNHTDGYMYGHITQFAIWPRATTQAQLISLTT